MRLINKKFALNSEQRLTTSFYGITATSKLVKMAFIRYWYNFINSTSNLILRTVPLQSSMHNILIGSPAFKNYTTRKIKHYT